MLADFHCYEPCVSHSFSRRDFLQLTARLATAAAIAGGPGLLNSAWARVDKGGTTGPTLKIGYLPITDATPLLVGHAKGFFAKEGLEVEKPVLMRSWSQIAEGFLAGNFNLVHLLIPVPIYMRYAQNYRVKVVAWNHMNGSALTVSPSKDVRRLEDIGGKQIAVPFWYSIHNVILQLCLRHLGLEAVTQERNRPLKSNQTNLFVMSPPDMPTALASGAIDGYIVAEPFNASGEVNAGGRIVRFTGDVFRNHPCCVAVMHEADVTRRRAWAQKVVNGLVRAQQWAEQNIEETARLLSRDGNGYLPLPEPIIKRAMTKYDLETYGPERGTGAIRHPDWSVKRIGFQPYPFKSTTREIVKLLKQTRMEGDSRFLQNLDPDRVITELFDYDLVTKAADKVGGLRTFEGINPANPYIRAEVIEV
jgi:NitT/TauT family transport system substrate-binding protein